MNQSNVFYKDVLSLGVTQIYLSSRKIDAVLQWFHPVNMDTYPPLPVFDFGDGLRLTDGHTRAYVAYRMGVKTLPVSIEQDEIVTGALGQKLYRADIEWAKRHGVGSVADLEGRVLSEPMYDVLWRRRCDRLYDLLTQVDDRTLKRLDRTPEGYFLYGASEDLTAFYYEDALGRLYVLKEQKLLPE